MSNDPKQPGSLPGMSGQLSAPVPPLVVRPPVLAYVFSLCGVLALGVIAVLGILLVRPKEDNSILIGLVLAMLAPTTTALLALISSANNATAIKDLHVIVNSRLSELLMATAASERSQGRAEGLAQSVTTGVDAPVAVQIRQPENEPIPVRPVTEP